MTLAVYLSRFVCTADGLCIVLSFVPPRRRSRGAPPAPPHHHHHHPLCITAASLPPCPPSLHACVLSRQSFHLCTLWIFCCTCSDRFPCFPLQSPFDPESFLCPNKSLTRSCYACSANTCSRICCWRSPPRCPPLLNRSCFLGNAEKNRLLNDHKHLRRFPRERPNMLSSARRSTDSSTSGTILIVVFTGVKRTPSLQRASPHELEWRITPSPQCCVPFSGMKHGGQSLLTSE